MKVSVIIAVLESYDAVKRQLIHFSRFFHLYDCELIIADDGSNPPISEKIPMNISMPFPMRIFRTHDPRPWSQPCARNSAAFKYARGEYLLFTDIDHIITEEALAVCCKQFRGDKMHFPRQPGVLLENGNIATDAKTLTEYGCKPAETGKITSHANTFCMRSSIFSALNGYESRFCGKYGGDDTDLNNRYAALHRAGYVTRSIRGPLIYVFPDPARDAKKIFHSLRTK